MQRAVGGPCESSQCKRPIVERSRSCRRPAARARRSMKIRVIRAVGSGPACGQRSLAILQRKRAAVVALAARLAVGGHARIPLMKAHGSCGARRLASCKQSCARALNENSRRLWSLRSRAQPPVLRRVSVKAHGGCVPHCGDGIILMQSGSIGCGARSRGSLRVHGAVRACKRARFANAPAA